MKRFISPVLLLATLACAFADLQFAVVAPGATAVQVQVGGNSYTLNRPVAAVPYFVGYAAVASADTYTYVADGTPEAFSRTFPAGRTKTYNDFWGRAETIKPLWTLAQVFPAWSRALGPNGIFEDDYISTVFFTGPGAVSFFEGPEKKNPNANPIAVTMINRDTFGHWPNAYAFGKNGLDSQKVQVSFYTDDYLQRSTFKLRPSFADPAFIREKIYNDILTSVGVPHQETSFARVYANDKGLGLYHLQEDTASWNFLTTQFHGKQWAATGDSWDCGTGADFGVNQGYGSIYSFKPREGSSAGQEKIKALQTATDAVQWSNTASVDAFSNNWFDADAFLRAMAVEYLSDHWDGYLFYTSNFVLYNDPTANKLFFIDQDFDQTFGVSYMNSANSFVLSSWQSWTNKTWTIPEDGSSRRVMWDNFLSNQVYQDKFVNILKELVRVVYNPLAMGKRVESMVARIKDDVHWDRNLGQNRARPGDLPFSAADFDTNVGTGSVTYVKGLMWWFTARANYIRDSLGVAFQDPPVQGSPRETTGTVGGSGVIVTPPGQGTTGAVASTGDASTAAGTSADATSADAGASTGDDAGTSTGASGETTTDNASGVPVNPTGVINVETSSAAKTTFAALIISAVVAFAL